MHRWTTDTLKGRRVAVVGLGKSGLAAARFCRGAGAAVTVSEAGQADRFSDAIAHLEPAGVVLEFGPHRWETFAKADLIVLSPGVPHTIPPLAAARRRGVPVVGEMELAARLIQEPMAAVTGTNGKTTTTELLGDMLKTSGIQVFVGGNIGNPLIEYVENATPVDWLVVEVSSFQLDTMETFHPRIGCLLNISEDHLDRYPDYAAYAASKWRLFQNQTANDTAVINGALIPEGTPPVPLAGTTLFFNGSPQGQPLSAVFREGAMILDGVPGRPRVTIDLSAIPLVGRHNAENAAAAGLAAMAAGASPEGIQTALNHFRGLPHRVTLVGEIEGVRYYDDSKATNVDAVVRALESFEGPVVLIMGGRDKGGSYRSLESLLREKVSHLIVLGEAAPIIRAALGGIVPVQTAADMASAVRLAAGCARGGDVVLLSPACSSFDMYTSYHHRGEDFCRHVQQLS